MPSTTFVARHPGPFSALVQRAEIDGLRLEPLAPVRVTDGYYDTDTGELLRHGLALRVREKGGRQTVGLQALDGDRDLPADCDLPGDRRADDRLDLPPGELRSAVERVTGDAPLMPLLSLRQYRTPRVARDGAATVGVLSFDVVVCEAPGAHVVSSEVEVESHSGDLPDRLAPVLRAQGLERSERSKFARALLRHPRALDQPVLLLPDEARELERAAASGDSQLRRRASAVLLDARGFRPDTIAAQTGMSMSRVRYWLQQFREVRLEMLGPAPVLPKREAPVEDTAPVAAPEPSPTPTPMTPVPTPARDQPALGAEPPARRPRPHDGDGMPPDPTGAADLAELLDLFAPAYPDTPHLDDGPPGDDAVQNPSADDDLSDDDLSGGDSADGRALAESVAEPADDRTSRQLLGEDEETAGPMRPSPRFPAPRLNPYPVVLGPVRVAREAAEPSPPGERPARAEANRTAPTGAARAQNTHAQASAQRLRPLAAVARAFATPTGDGTSGRPGAVQSLFEEIDLQQLRRAAAPGAQPASAPPAGSARLRLSSDTPLADAARRSLDHSLSQFEARSDRFLGSGAPSDARRLLVAVQQLRLTAETFSPVLPPHAVRQLVAGLRPLATSLGVGLGHACRAALAPNREGVRREDARHAVARLADAAADLGRLRESGWEARARRLLGHLGRPHAADLAEPAPDNLVGQPGDAPAPTRLGHVLGSAVWSRFEAVRAFEDRLAQPTPELVAHLAVALGALRFVLTLAQPAAADVTAALDDAERAVTRARHRADAATSGAEATKALDALPGVWSETVAAPFRRRLAEVVAAV